MHHGWSVLFAVVGFVVGLGVVSVDASPIYYSQLVVGAQNLNIAQIDSDSTTPITTDTLGPIDASVLGATSVAFVTDGVLGAGAWAISSGSDTQFNSALAQAAFTDTLTLQSSSLSIGTDVQLLINIALSSLVSSTNQSFDGCQAAVTGTADVYAGFTLLSHLNPSNVAWPCVGSSSGTATITAKIGDEILINMVLYAAAGARSGADATADATHSLRLFADPLGDFTYVAASGNNYLTQTTLVPEPASVMLLGIGLAGTVLRVRRQRRSLVRTIRT